MLVELGQQVEQQGATGLRERQVAELVEDDQVHAHERVGQTVCLPACRSQARPERRAMLAVDLAVALKALSIESNTFQCIA